MPGRFLLLIPFLAAACAGPAPRPSGPDWLPEPGLDGSWRTEREGVAALAVSMTGGTAGATLHLLGEGAAEVSVRTAREDGEVVGTYRRGLGWHLDSDPEPRELRAGVPFRLEPGTWANLQIGATHFDVVVRRGREEEVLTVRFVEAE